MAEDYSPGGEGVEGVEEFGGDAGLDVEEIAGWGPVVNRGQSNRRNGVVGWLGRYEMGVDLLAELRGKAKEG